MPACLPACVPPGQMYVSSVEPDGTFVAADGARFSSPSAWAIHCKRQTNPEKRSDDGYRSIRRVRHLAAWSACAGTTRQLHAHERWR
jgi:hypothetical protein